MGLLRFDGCQQGGASMTSPLPLTTIEECLYWQDRPAYPWSWFARLEFSGCLDRAAFETALASAVARHPLLTAKVETVGRGRLRWRPVDDPRPIVRWETGAVGGPPPAATYLDLQREIGIRFHVRTDTTASELIIQFHHACCDGLGGILFIEDLLLAYALACGSPPGQLKFRPLDPHRLRRRGRLGLSLPALLRMAPQQLVGVIRGRQFLTRRAVPLVPHRACPNGDNPPQNYPTTLRYCFDEETTRRGRRAAQGLGVTLNDVLIRDLFLALAEWRSRQNIGDDGDWLRMVIPMNLRRAEARFLPAANMVGNAFLDRRGRDFADPARLLRGIHKEMALVRRWHLGLAFIFLANVYRWLPGGLERSIRADRCLSSCMLTNVGKPFGRLPLSDRQGRLVAGNVTLENIGFIPPTSPYSCVSVCLTMFARRLGFTMHYDPRPLSAGQAADLLDTYVRHIRDSIAAPP
jgi:hypothetical protein